jgi:guanine nucleotide-binding protein subunit beta-2-like 1 protein
MNQSKLSFSLAAGEVVNGLVFSPVRFWLAAATDAGMKIFDLHQKKTLFDLRLQPQDLDAEDPLPSSSPSSSQTNQKDEGKKKLPKCPKCLSVAFSADGNYLFTGFSDGKIRCYNLSK